MAKRLFIAQNYEKLNRIRNLKNGKENKHMDLNIFRKMREEREENRKNNPENKPTQAQATMKVICGGYLFYLIYQIIREGGLRENHGWQLALMILGIVAFAVAGAYCIVEAAKMFLKNDFYNPNAPAASKREERDGESVSAGEESADIESSEECFIQNDGSSDEKAGI